MEHSVSSCSSVVIEMERTGTGIIVGLGHVTLLRDGGGNGEERIHLRREGWEGREMI